MNKGDSTIERWLFTLLAVVLLGCEPGSGAATADAGTLVGAVRPADAGCPATWSVARPLCTTACSLTLTCTYPGAGDCPTSGACADAVISCAQGPDAGRWACGQ